MEKKEFKFLRAFKRKKQCNAFIKAYRITDYEIKNTSFKREYKGRLATSSQYTVYFYPTDEPQK